MDRADSQTQGSEALREQSTEHIERELPKTCPVNQTERLQPAPNLHPGYEDHIWPSKDAGAQGNWD